MCLNSFSKNDVYGCFMNRVLTTPMETMIYTEKNCITYYEVFQMVQVCASKIQAETCGQRKRIVLNLDHTFKILVAILATLKCGCSYVPTSKNISETSLNEIANWCNTDIIVTDDFRETNLKQIVLKDSFASTTNLEGMCSLINKEKYYTYRADDEVYVLFTSGSTGKPKGCSVSYSNLLYIIDNMMEIGKFVPSDVMQFSTPYTFDVSTTEIYSFMYGVSIFICDLSVFDKFKMWPELSYKHQITHLATSPSVFKNILNCFSEEQLNRLFKYMKCVMLAGEVFHKEIFVSWEKNAWEFHLWNLYGPTEATVYATCFELVHESKIETSVPIGKCLKGCVYNIVDMHDGVGELVLGGAGISSGYINNQAENDLRFYCENGKRFYKTGDLVSEENGVLMYHGRNDDQVQINGIRVELGEIEARIKQIYYISEAVVLYIRERIIAFIQIKKEYTFFLEDIRNEISRSLPRYMVPNVINIVESFTLNLNNKIDRQLLRSSYQDSILPKTNYTQDSNVEEIISIMMECLDGEAPRRMQGDDDFFEYGGDSLDAMHLALCIEEKYNLKFGVDQIYLHRTPAKIAHSITSLKNQSRLSERTYELVDPGVFYPIDQSVQRYLFADATRIDSYNPTFRQHSYYHNNRKNIISFSYILGKTYSMIEISTALSELLRKNPILYSKIKNENRIIVEEFLFEESTSFPHLSMNSRPDNIEEELRRRYEDLMLKARYDHGFLALFILAEYNDSIEIIGLLDHTISDLASVSIFKQALSNILNKVNTPHNLSFRNYCMIVNDMNTDLNSGNSYFKSLSEWSSVDKDYLLDIIEDFCLYDIIDPPLQKGSINISVYISYIVAKRICSAANIKKVVVSTIFNLRDYTRLPFEYTIGDMHNTVNFMYEYGMSLDEFTKRAQNVLQFYAKKMLYVPQLINNSKVLEHTNQYKLVKKIENAIVTSVNFIGSVNDNELNILLNGLSEIQEKLYDEKRSIYVTVAESRNKLHLFTNKKI